MRFALILALVVAAAAGGGWYWYQSRAESSVVRYRLAKLERGPMAAAVAASGTLNAVATVPVGSQISGQVKDIYADFNTPVKKGQVMALIDPATFELRVNQTRADLDAAESAASVARSSLAGLQAEFGRMKIARDSTREQLKAVQAQIEVSQGQVQSAVAAVKQRDSLLRQAQIDLERTVIRAPVDGTVVLRNVAAGQTVAPSRQAPVLFTIAQDLRDMQVEAAIDEADVGRLRVGLPATFAVDAFPRRNFNGEIQQIRKSLPNAQNAVSYTVVISAPNPDLTLLPGMTANVRIVVENRDSVLKVPNAALRWRPPGAADVREPGVGRVYVLEDGAPRPRDARLGLTDGTTTELVAGALTEGMEVIVGTATAGRSASK
ncbi:MAG TPA: efflux RND transporter periplasmic adaptor subunit [Burkholderiales bacterium]|nr:efflux RND transporter periplasmic adaptor subunit [Burkholderiales bacterium]